MRLNDIKKAFLASAALLSAMSMSAADRFVSFQQGDLLINGNDKVEIYMDANDCRGVSYAANALVKDIRNVSGSQATITSNRKATILVGTIGHSAAIDQLIKQKRINGNLLKEALRKSIEADDKKIKTLWNSLFTKPDAFKKDPRGVLNRCWLRR